MRPRWTRTRPKGPKPAKGKIARALVLLLRVLAACLALSLSGVLHFAVDIWVATHGGEHPASDCSDDSDCPPGCASCHCTHSTPALPVPFQPTQLSVVLPHIQSVGFPAAQGPPLSTYPSGIYRPPRV
ncbi:MAG: hypothetical protein IPK82_27775 [Polyangiaceae bacterium]|nr:hypothetical protein [Polyangiaceae bacterium]